MPVGGQFFYPNDTLITGSLYKLLDSSDAAATATTTNHGTGGSVVRQVVPYTNGTGGATAIPAVGAAPTGRGWRVDLADMGGAADFTRSIAAGQWNAAVQIDQSAALPGAATVTAILYKVTGPGATTATEIARGSAAGQENTLYEIPLSPSGGGGSVPAQSFNTANESFQIEYYISAAGVAITGNIITFRTITGTAYVVSPQVIKTISTETGGASSPRVGGSGGMTGEASPGAKSYYEEVIADSPLLYWPLDDTAGFTQDYSPNNRTGTVVGTVTRDQPGAAPATGRSYDFAGGRVDSTLVITATDVRTLEVWIKRDVINNQQHNLLGTTSTLGGWAAVFSGVNMDLVFNAGGGGGAVTWTEAQHGMVVGTWYHLVLTHNGATGVSELFVNGVSKGTRTSGGWQGGTDPTQIGAANNGNNLDGSMDEFAVYSGVLSAARILAHYNARNETPQFARPDSDIQNPDGWETHPTAGQPRWQQLDDYSDTDFTRSPNTPPSDDMFEVGLTNVTDPQSSSGHVLRVRARKDGSVGEAGWTCTTQLYQGNTQIATATHALRSDGPNWSTFHYTLTAAEANAITDYTNLRVRVIGDAPNGSTIFDYVAVGWVEFQTPTAGISGGVPSVGKRVDVRKDGGSIRLSVGGGPKKIEFADTGGSTSPRAGGGVKKIDYADTGGAVSPRSGGGSKKSDVARLGGGVSPLVGGGVGKREVRKNGGSISVAIAGGPKKIEFADTGGASSARVGGGARVVQAARSGGGLRPGVGGGSKVATTIKVGGGIRPGVGGGSDVLSITKLGGAISARMGGGVGVLATVKAGGAISPRTAGGAKILQVVRVGGGLRPGVGGGVKTAQVVRAGGGILAGRGGGPGGPHVVKLGGARSTLVGGGAGKIDVAMEGGAATAGVGGALQYSVYTFGIGDYTKDGFGNIAVAAKVSLLAVNFDGSYEVMAMGTSDPVTGYYAFVTPSPLSDPRTYFTTAFRSFTGDPAPPPIFGRTNENLVPEATLVQGSE